jgi:opacity protein-like surface antigen
MTTISLITPKRLLLTAAALLLALAIAAAAPALSRADVYCVHQAGFTCPVGSVDEGKNLQPALNDAASNPSTPSAPNLLTIGPGTYQPSPAGSGFSANIQYPLQVRGSGVGRTSLTDSAASAVIALAGTSPNLVTLSALTVGGSADYGVSIAARSIARD